MSIRRPGTSRYDIQLVAAERDIGLRGTLAEYLELAWSQIEPGQEYCHNWHIDCYSEHCQAVLNGEIRNLVINVPPGFSKSIAMCVAFPTWAWARMPWLRWIFASFRESNSVRDARRSLELIRTPWYQDRWGDCYQIGPSGAEGSRIPTRDPQVKQIRTTKGGSRESTTVEGGITGSHCNIMVFDDPVNPRDIDRTTLESAIEARQLKFSTRWIAPGLNSEITIMQRLHERDLAGHILATVTGAVHVNLPMHYDSSRKCTTMWFTDPRETEGELLDPARFTEEKVIELARDLTIMHARAQLEQDPTPESGSLFKREWFRYYKVAPKSLHDYCISVDCAFKDLATSDYVVIQVWARDDLHFYLLDQVRGKWDFPETLRQVKVVIKQWPQAFTKLIEDKANGSAIIQVLSKEVTGILPVTPEGGKVARANAVTKFFETFSVYFPELAPWCAQDLEPELLKFPRGKNDDQVDTMSQALTWLSEHQTRYAVAMAQVFKAGGLKY